MCAGNKWDEQERSTGEAKLSQEAQPRIPQTKQANLATFASLWDLLERLEDQTYNGTWKLSFLAFQKAKN